MARINERLDADAAAWWDLRGDPAVRERLIQHYLPFAERTASSALKKDNHRSIQIDEVISAAYLALIQSIDRFDPKSKAAFTTFAYWRIWGECIEVAREHDWVPHGVRSASNAGEKDLPLMLPLNDEVDLTEPSPDAAPEDPDTKIRRVIEGAPESSRDLLNRLLSPQEDPNIQRRIRRLSKFYGMNQGQLRLVARCAIAVSLNSPVPLS